MKAPFQHLPLALPDQLLFQRACDGDAPAFQVLVRSYLPAMRAYALKLTGSTADADDALQETLLTAWQKLDTLDDPSKVKSWLMTLTGRKYRSDKSTKSQYPHRRSP